MKNILSGALLLISLSVSAQSRFSTHELSLNAFRNPSIGLEYRYKPFSVHAGYYPTAFESGITTSFFRAGLTYWFLPVGKKENPSSFYVSGSYLRGFSRDYKNENAFMTETGFRWMIWKGLNFRIGVAFLASKAHSLKVNPTPGIGYAFFFPHK